MFKYVVPLALCLTLASPSLASSPDQPPSARVSYVDLDLTRAEGRETLDRRLAKAARSVCPVLNRSSVAERFAAHACARRARAKARVLAQVAAAKAQLRLAQSEERVASR